MMRSIRLGIINVQVWRAAPSREFVTHNPSVVSIIAMMLVYMEKLFKKKN